jgi:hypothetical protein
MFDALVSRYPRAISVAGAIASIGIILGIMFGYIT